MRAEQKTASLMAGPYAAFLLVFAVYPIAFALVLVFLQWDLVTAPTFAGADNIRLLVHDGRFWRAVANTFVFLSIHVPLQIVTALALALTLNRQLVGRSFWRAAFFLPVVISGAVVAILWSQLYATDVGLINRLLLKIGLSPVPWLTDPRTAMPAIAVMVTWKNVGFYVIIYLAGLQYIPRSCQEAIEIEGASAWQRFRYLTLPSLLPQTILVVTLSTHKRLPALHRAVRDDWRGPAQAHVLRGALLVQQRLRVPEDGLCGDDRCRAGADHRHRRLCSASLDWEG